MIRLLDKGRVSLAWLLFIAVVGAVGWTACAPEPPKDLPPSGLPDRAVNWEHRGQVGMDGVDPRLKFPDGVTFEIKSRLAEIEDGGKVHRAALGDPTDRDRVWIADATGSDNIWAAGGRSVCHWDGRSWKTMATFDEVSDVATAGSKDAWALSFEGGRTVLRSWRDGTWSDLKADAELSDIASGKPKSLWAVSKNKVLHHDGTRWSDHTPATDAHFTSIAVADDGSVWVGTDRHYVLTFTDGLWSRTRMPVPAKVEDEETGIEGDPDWSIWKVAAYSGAIEVTAHWWDELDGSDGIYDWHVYRTPVNAEPEAVSRPSEGL